MTEQEWLTCTNPQKMLNFPRGKASKRKLRLFDCACCRLVWHLLEHAELKRAVESAEQFADGLIDHATLVAAGAAAVVAVGEVQQDTESEDSPAPLYASRAAADVADSHAGFAYRDDLEPYRNVAEALANRSHPRCYWRRDGSLGYGSDDPNWPGSKVHHRAEALARMAGLLRDIFANLFRPITINPTWLTWHDGLLVSMARQMYGSRDFTDMPILGDALEEAGCTDKDILSHCRGPGPHVRGCWVVDTILGKT
jgi:hypothetical protein